MLRLLLVTLTAAALAACNLVVTPEPMFTAADAQGGPQLRPGLWTFADREGCRFDTGAPLAQWPDCAEWGVVREGQIVAWQEEGQWRSEPLLITAGQPQLVQLRVTMEGEQPAYYYAVFAPTARDGPYVTAFTITPVLCGPPDRPAPDEPPAPATRHPFPGIIMDGTNCRPSSADALREAGRLTMALDERPSSQSARWIRDGDR